MSKASESVRISTKMITDRLRDDELALLCEALKSGTVESLSFYAKIRGLNYSHKLVKAAIYKLTEDRYI